MKTILCILLGYLLGSLPFALIIGKVFYHTDIRQYGSGNLGGTNAGRVLGKKAGISVIVFDVLKVVLAIAIATQVSKVAGIWTGLACCIGHCYPVFAKFHGGKAVSTMFGFLFSTSIFLFQDASYLLVPFGMFLVVLCIFGQYVCSHRKQLIHYGIDARIQRGKYFSYCRKLANDSSCDLQTSYKH